MQTSTLKSDFVPVLRVFNHSRTFKRSLTFLFSFLLFVALAENAFAGNYKSKNNGNWHDPGTWTPEGVPSSLDDVTISKGDIITITDHAACKSLTIFSSGSDTKLSINGAFTLSVLNDVVLESPGSGSNNAFFDIGNGTLMAGNLNIKAVNGNKIARVTVLNGRIETNNVSFNSVSNAHLQLNGTATLKMTGDLGLGGTLTANVTSTIIFNGQVLQTIPKEYSYGNVIAANPAGVKPSGILGAGVIKGNLTVQSGIFDNVGNNVTGAATKTIKVMEGASLALGGTTTFPTGFDYTILDPTSTVIYQGTSQTIAVKNYSNLTIANGGTKTLGGSLNLTGNLNLNSTKLMIGNNVLTLEPAANITGASAAGYIVPGVTGKLAIKNIGSNGRNGQVLFPVGTAASYTPAYLTNFGPANTFSVNMAEGVKEASSQMITNDVVKKTWNISNETSIGTLNVTVKLQWNEATDQGTPFSTTKCGVRHFYNSAWDWPNAMTTAACVSGTAPNRILCITRSGINSFSPFTVGSGINPLPVEMICFKVTKQGEAALLEWETATEKNNQGFEIQSSADGRSFDRIGFVESHDPNSSMTQRYSYTDAHSKTGLWYYRIKQTDLDGTVSYYGPKVIDFGKSRNLVNVYPNPFTDQFEVKVQAATASEAAITLHDLSGKLVYAATEKLTAGNNHIVVKPEYQYPEGFYILTAKTAGKVFVSRLVKQ